MKRSSLVAAGVVVTGLLFGLLGGEYTVLDHRALRRQAAEQRAAIARLDAEIDSLAAVADSLERDRATIERVAREDLGMLRPGELLFRVEDAVR